MGEDNKLYAIGNNYKEQFGIQTKEEVCNEWTKIEFAPDNIVHIAARYEYSIFLTANGDLYAAGECNYGALGLGKDVKQSKQLLARIPIKTKFKKIATGDSHCVAIDEDDHLWSWGFNDERQCGHGHNDKCIWKPTLIESMKNIKIIKTGRYYNLAVTQSNDYYFWGHNDSNHACLDYDTVKHVKIPKLAFTDKYQKINDVFLGYNITQIVYTVSGKQQSFDMKQGLKNGFMRFDILKLVLDEEPIVAAEEKKNIEYNDDSKVDNELQHVDDNKLDDDNKANNKSNNDDLKDKNKQKQNEKELEEKKRKEEEEAAEALKLAEEEEAAKKKAEEEEAGRVRLEEEEKKKRGRRSCSKEKS